MSTESQIHKTDRPTFKILKWIGAGGFGNVFKVLRNDKIVACKQIETDNLDFALDEHRHMTLVRGGPHIAAVHDGIEWNAKTKTLSFFMDYYKGKDLNRQVEMLRATGERFTEFQIIDIAYQIAVALEHCHGRNLLHQDMKPMNILLSEAWDPTTQGAVPHLFLADFGIASHVQTIGTRLTGRRGTPGYEAPEIRAAFAAFSQKSDIYAVGCILYRLITLSVPSSWIDDVQPAEISDTYSQDLLIIVSAMLSSTREARPTATELKEYLMAHIHRNVSPTATECHACHRVFFSLDKAREHFQRCPGDVWTTTYQTKDTFPTVSPVTHHTLLPSPRDSIPTQPLGFVSTNDHGNPTKTRGEASTPDMHTSYTLNKHFSEKTFHPPPCAACLKTFHSKRKLYTHLYCGHHVRRPKYVHNKLSQNRKRWPRDNGHIGDTWSNRTTMYMQETPSYRQDYPHNPQGDSITGLPIIHT